MLNFFRRIRQRLIDNGTLKKYLVYAIGEILLVMIGILLALQINNWNDYRKNRNTEIGYLSDMRNNIEEDIGRFEDMLIQDTVIFNSYGRLIKAFTDESIRNNNSLMSSTLDRTIRAYFFEIHRIVFDDMKSSGKLNLIRSDSLRFSIQEYYDEAEAKERLQQVNNDIINDLKDETFTRNIDVNSVLESIFPEGQRTELNSLDLSFFQKDANSKEVQLFVNRVSIMRTAFDLNSSFRKELLTRAKALEQEISDYLSDKIE